MGFLKDLKEDFSIAVGEMMNPDYKDSTDSNLSDQDASALDNIELPTEIMPDLGNIELPEDMLSALESLEEAEPDGDKMDFGNIELPELTSEEQDMSEETLYLEELEDLDTIEDLQDMLDSEDLDTIEDLEDMLDSEDLDTIEDLENMLDFENLDKIEGLEDIEDTENRDAIEELEDLSASENIDILSNLEEIREADDSETAEDLEDIKNIGNLNIAEELKGISDIEKIDININEKAEEFRYTEDSYTTEKQKMVLDIENPDTIAVLEDTVPTEESFIIEVEEPNELVKEKAERITDMNFAENDRQAVLENQIEDAAEQFNNVEDEKTMDDMLNMDNVEDMDILMPEGMTMDLEEDASSESLADSMPEMPMTQSPLNKSMDSENAGSNTNTIITKGTVINGSMTSDSSLEILGTINGDIECLGKVTVEGSVKGSIMASEVFINSPQRINGNVDSKGTVKVGVGTIILGDITAASAVIAGAVKGKIDINGPLVLDSTAIVKGDINARSIQINNGAIVDGYCSLTYANVDIDTIFESDEEVSPVQTGAVK